MNRRILGIIFFSISYHFVFSQLSSFKGLSTPVSIDYRSPKEYEVGGITVTGAQFLDPNALISITGLKVGDRITVPGDVISDAVKKLWNQGILSDVEIYATGIEGDKIFLEIYLKERPRLSSFSFNGISKSDADNIKEKINLVRGKVVTDVLMQHAQLSVKRYFIDKGFLQVQVNVVQKTDSALSNYARLYIDVKKGSKIKVHRIYFEGNQSFTDKKLKGRMKEVHEKIRFTVPYDIAERIGRLDKFRLSSFLYGINTLFSPKHITEYLAEHVRLNIFSSSKFKKSDFETDKQTILDFYRSNGYRDVAMVADTVYAHDKKSINIRMTIEEGMKYYFRNIYWKGNYVYDSTILNRTVGIKKGTIYSKEELEKKLTFNPEGTDISSLYMDDGYLFFNIQPVEVNVDGDSVDVEMRIEEGVQADINKVIVTGNTKTSDRVILREIRTIPGQKFNRSLLIRTQRELSTLGYFDPEKIGINPIPNPKTGKVDIEYNLTEKPNDQIELSAGWSGAGLGFFGTVGLVFNNFSIRKIPHFHEWNPVPGGDGQRLALRVQANGPNYQTYSFSFTEPWLGGKKPHAFSLGLTHTILRQLNPDAVSLSIFRITEVSMSLGRRLKVPDDFFILSNALSFKQYQVINDQGKRFGFDNGVAHNINFNTTFSRNSIDNPLYPRHGSNLSLAVSLTPPYSILGIDVKNKFIEYYKTMLDISFFTNLFGNMVLNTRAHAGFLGRYNPDLPISSFERFDVGGDGLVANNFLLGTDVIGLRGYDNLSLNPINPAYLTNPLAQSTRQSGTAYTKFVFELRHPITLNPSATIYALAFMEGANNWANPKEYNPFKLYRSVGVGVRLFLPALGLLGIDYGYGLDPVPGLPNANRRGIMFIIGQQLR